MDQKASVILQDIGETRTALAEKITLLEGQVKETMSLAKSSVEETIGNVRDTVNETVESVKDTLSIRKRVREHPWTLLGISVGAGFLVGRKLNSSPKEFRYGNQASDFPLEYASTEGTPPQHIYQSISQPMPRKPFRSRASFAHKFADFFHDEIEMAKGMLMTAAMEKVRETATKAFPKIQENIDRIVKSAETKVQPK